MLFSFSNFLSPFFPYSLPVYYSINTLSFLLLYPNTLFLSITLFLLFPFSYSVQIPSTFLLLYSYSFLSPTLSKYALPFYCSIPTLPFLLLCPNTLYLSITLFLLLPFSYSVQIRSTFLLLYSISSLSPTLSKYALPFDFSIPTSSFLLLCPNKLYLSPT